MNKLPEKDVKKQSVEKNTVDWVKFINNDTIAVAGLILVALISIFMGIETIASACIGAIGGYIGSKTSQ